MSVAAIFTGVSFLSSTDIDHLAEETEKGILIVPFFNLNKIEVHTFSNDDTAAVQKKLGMSVTFDEVIENETSDLIVRKPASDAVAPSIFGGSCSESFSLSIQSIVAGISSGISASSQNCLLETDNAQYRRDLINNRNSEPINISHSACKQICEPN